MLLKLPKASIKVATIYLFIYFFFSVFILLTFLTLVACSNKQVMLGKKCLKEVNGNETITTKSYVWLVNKDHDWSSDLTKGNCK